MKRGAIILLLGLLVCTAAFSGFYYFGTRPAREMAQAPQPELLWLKKEFHLGDAEFARITKLHQAYLPKCAERCRVIEELNTRLKDALAQATTVTPQIQGLLAERATRRAECEAEMLAHFLEVSRTMPPEQGRRYLRWVEEQTCLQGQAMETRHHSEPHNHSQHQM